MSAVLWAVAALSLSSGPAQLPAQVQAFVQRVFKAQGVDLAQSWKVPGGTGDAWLLRFADPKDPTAHQVPLVLWQSADEVWVRRAFNTGREVEVTPDEAQKRFRLTLTDRTATYGIRDGHPVNVVVARDGKLDDLGEGHEVRDWDALTFQRTLEAGEGKAKKTVETDEGAILLVTTEDPAALPKTWAERAAGKQAGPGVRSTALQVRAEPAEEGISLRLKIRDGTPVPVPSRGTSQAFRAADHFELWWQSPQGLRQVGVGVDPKGAVHLRALFAKTKPLILPTASLEDKEIVVTFPASSLGGDAALAKGVPFTVAYSDATPGTPESKPRTSVVSTSAFQFRPSTLGTLIVLPGFSRWPAVDDDTPWCPYRPESRVGDWSDC